MMARFIRWCRNSESHTGHEYVKHWVRDELPLLHQPERYPVEWDSMYACRGVKLPGKTWAESLGIDVPADAPGGQRIGRLIRSPSGLPQNRVNIQYDGFYDTDAYGRD